MYALAGLVCVATLLGETIAAVVTGNTARIVQAVFRAMFAGAMASIGGSILLSVAGGLSDLGQIALASSGASVDAPLVPLQEVLMESAQLQETGAELFVVFLAALVIVFTSLAIYFTLAMRPVLLAAIIVFLPVAHALSVWTPMRRVEIRTWALAFAVLLADAAILTMFAVANTAMGQPEGVDRLIFGTVGLLLAALAPAASTESAAPPEAATPHRRSSCPYPTLCMLSSCAHAPPESTACESVLGLLWSPPHVSGWASPASCPFPRASNPSSPCTPLPHPVGIESGGSCIGWRVGEPL
jgi:hypothetical protein